MHVAKAFARATLIDGKPDCLAGKRLIEVKLVPAAVIKRYLAGQMNDAADIAEAASWAEVCGIHVKWTDTQGHTALFRTRAMLAQRRTAVANAIRCQLLEFGIVIARGFAALSAWRADLNDGKLEMPEALPEIALASLEILFEQLDDLNARVEACEAKMLEVTKSHEDCQRHQTVPGVDPINAYALLAFVGDLDQFKNCREFAAWVGLTPKQHSAGGRQRLGGITKMRQRDLRHLLVQGAMTQLRHMQARVKELPPNTQKMLANKPRKVSAVAMANRTARILWSFCRHKTIYDWKRTMGIEEVSTS